MGERQAHTFDADIHSQRSRKSPRGFTHGSVLHSRYVKHCNQNEEDSQRHEQQRQQHLGEATKFFLHKSKFVTDWAARHPVPKLPNLSHENYCKVTTHVLQHQTSEVICRFLRVVGGKIQL